MTDSRGFHAFEARLPENPPAPPAGTGDNSDWPDVFDCPACDSDGGPCAVCKPDSGRWMSNEEIAAKDAALTRLRDVAKIAVEAWDARAPLTGQNALVLVRNLEAAMLALRAELGPTVEEGGPPV